MSDSGEHVVVPGGGSGEGPLAGACGCTAEKVRSRNVLKRVLVFTIGFYDFTFLLTLAVALTVYHASYFLYIHKVFCFNAYGSIQQRVQKISRNPVKNAKN